MSATPDLSVVIVALNEALHLRPTVENLQASLPDGSEMIVVDDGSTDGGADFLAEKGGGSGIRLVRAEHLGIAKARNLGASLSRGKVIVFADAHVAAPPGWFEPMMTTLENPAVGAVAPAISDMEDQERKGYGVRFRGPDLEMAWLEPRDTAAYPVPLLPGCFLGMRRDVFEATGGFDPGMMRWGSNDNEVSVRLWLLGYELWVVPQIAVAHFFRDRHPYSVDWTSVLHNALRLSFVHFDRQRFAQVVEAFREQEAFPPALAQMLDGDACARRVQLASRRVHDCDWLFRKFHLDFEEQSNTTEEERNPQLCPL